MKPPRRILAIVLACVIGVGALALLADTTTIRLSPDFRVLHLESHTAFSGELIEVKLGPGFTSPVTSDPNVVVPVSTDWFVAAQPGKALAQRRHHSV